MSWSQPFVPRRQRGADPARHSSGLGANLLFGGDPRRICGRARAPEICIPADEIAAVLAMFRRQGERIVPRASTAVSVDPGDTKFLHCVEAAKADYLVTGKQAMA